MNYIVLVMVVLLVGCKMTLDPPPTQTVTVVNSGYEDVTSYHSEAYGALLTVVTVVSDAQDFRLFSTYEFVGLTSSQVTAFLRQKPGESITITASVEVREVKHSK